MHTKNSVSKKLLALALAVLMCISVVPLGIAFANGNTFKTPVVYNPESGFEPLDTEIGFTSMAEAINYLNGVSPEGGTIKVYDAVILSGGIDDGVEGARGPITIEGYEDPDFDTLTILDGTYSELKGDVTFKNIGFDCRSFATNGFTVTFAEGCRMIDGDPLISLDAGGNKDIFVINSGNWGRIFPSMAASITKDYDYTVATNFNNPIEATYLGLYTGAGGTLNGDINFTMNTGAYFDDLAIGSCSFSGHYFHNGVLTFTVNGGYALPTLGRLQTETNPNWGYQQNIQNLVFIFNKKTMDHDFAFHDRMMNPNIGLGIIVINNNEVERNIDVGNIEYITETRTDGLTGAPGYRVLVNNGQARPVFERTDASDASTAYLAGFEITSDTEGYVPAVGGVVLEKGENDLYDLSAFQTGGYNIIEISFVEYVAPKTPVVAPAGTEVAENEELFTDTESAIESLGVKGGTIYIKGAVEVAELERAADLSRGLVTIEGYGSTATGNSINITGENSEIKGDILFKNVNFNCRGFATYGHTVTFGEGVTTPGDPLVAFSGLGSKDIFVIKSGSWARIISYMGGAVQKDYDYTIDGVNLTGDTTYLGCFNNGGLLVGDINFTLNSGSINDVYIGGSSGAQTQNGVLTFTVNGGSFGTVVLGSKKDDIASQRIDNLAFIFNKKTMDNDIAFAARKINPTVGLGIIVINNAEVERSIDIGNIEYITETRTDGLTDGPGYRVTVTNGQAKPVFKRTDANDASTAYLAGFELTSDSEGLIAYANGVKLTSLNADGLYDLSSYRTGVSNDVAITFEVDQGEPGVYYVKAGGTGSGATQSTPAKSVAWLINNVISKEYTADDTVTIYVLQDDDAITSSKTKANFAVWNTEDDGTPAAHEATIVIKSFADGTTPQNYLGYYENIGASYRLYMQGPTVFDNVNIVITYHDLGYISTNGYDLTINEATNFYFLNNATSGSAWAGTFEEILATERHGMFWLTRNDIGGQGGKLILNKKIVLDQGSQFQADTSTYRFNFGDDTGAATFNEDVSFYINAASKFNLRVGQGTAGGVNTFAKNASFIIAAKGAIIDFNATSTATTTIGGALQIIRNSDARVSGGDALLQLKNNANGYWNLRTFNGEEAMFIDVTETAGIFSVAEGKTVLAIHQNGTIVKSEDGILDLSALQGDYDVYSSDYTTGSESYSTFDKAVYIKEATTIDLAALTPAITEGKAFLGWKLYNGTLPAMGEGTVTAELAAGTVLVAEYADVDVNYGGDFFIEGIQMRASSANKAQAVRFIVEMKKASADIVGGISQVVEYGSLILPLEYNWGKDLRYNTEIFNIGFEGDIKLGKPRAVPAVNIYAESEDAIQFTVAVTGITADKFLRNYSVQGYIRYLDANGVERVLYSGYGQSSLYRTALFADADDTASAEVKAEAAAIIEAVAAAGAELEATKTVTALPTCVEGVNGFAAYNLANGMRVIEYTIDVNGSADPTEIISFNDTHFVYTNSEDYFNADEAAISTGLSAGRSYYEKLGTPARIVKFMQYAAYANKTVVNGDVVDYVSAGTLQQAKRVIFNQDYSVTANSSVIAAAGNHEYMHQLDSNENLKTIEEVVAQAQASWPNDIVFHKEIVTNDAGENAVMVLLVDNVDGIAEQTAAALDEAREAGVPVIVFTHVPMVEAHQFYAPIVANNDIVKAVFTAHTHGYGYAEVEGIPHFTMGSAAEGNDNPNTVLKIKVK